MRMVSVRLFGQFRDLRRESEIKVSVEDHWTAAELKSQLAVLLDAAKLVSVSAVADDTHILNTGECLGLRNSFAILPPVSGG